MRLMLTTQAIEIMRRALAKFMVPTQKRVTWANEPIIGKCQDHGEAFVVTKLQGCARQLHSMHRVNQIGFCGRQHRPEHFDDLRIVVFSSRRMVCTTQIVMYLG